MKIRIIWVGRTRERYVAEGISHYLGRLKPLAEVEIIEVKDHAGLPRSEALGREGRGILRRSGAFVLFDETGRRMTSPAFARMLRDRSRMDFVLGGPWGVSPEVEEAARETVALSAMTFPHELVRLVALEQLYRGLMINAGRGYHH